MHNLLPYKRILITGGSGFIGSALIRKLTQAQKLMIFNLDKRLDSSENLSFFDQKAYQHLFCNLNNQDEVYNAIKISDPEIIIHLAAESHVDRSIVNPRNFIESNIVGTFNLLQASTNFWRNLSLKRKSIFKFIHISTDEVYGSLGEKGEFNENSSYAPNSPYSASKAGSDHLVRSWNKTYGLPTLITNCSNNYGPRQFPEKFIPLIIQKIINNSKIPIYGNGNNIRDWLFVKDHVNALLKIANDGENGARYCIGGGQEIQNIELVKLICEKMDKKLQRNQKSSRLITHVPDRPGHDYRYSIDYSLIKDKLNWSPDTPLEKGIEKTLDWYLNNQLWCKEIVEKSKYNLQRLGI